MPKRKFRPSLALLVNLLGPGFLILRLKFLLHFLKGHTDDSATLLRGGTLAIMDTAAANLSVGDLIEPLAALLICPIIPESISLGTPVTVLLLIVSEMAFTKRPFFFVKRLPLRGNDHFDLLIVDLLKFLRIRVACIRAGYLAGLLQHLIGLFDLSRKLIHIRGFLDRLRMNN